MHSSPPISRRDLNRRAMAGVVGEEINDGFPKVSHGWNNQAMPPAPEGRINVKVWMTCLQTSTAAGP